MNANPFKFGLDLSTNQLLLLSAGSVAIALGSTLGYLRAQPGTVRTQSLVPSVTINLPVAHPSKAQAGSVSAPGGIPPQLSPTLLTAQNPAPIGTPLVLNTCNGVEGNANLRLSPTSCVLGIVSWGETVQLTGNTLQVEGLWYEAISPSLGHQIGWISACFVTG
jgi:hypothetical protein